MGGKYLLPLHMECKRVKCQCDEFSSQFCKYKQAAKPKKVKAKPKARKKKLIPIPKIDTIVWEFCSIAFRLQDADKMGNASCSTCNTQLYYYGTGKAHMGHFLSRRFRNTKFLRTNMSIQCSTCNSAIYHGRPYEMGRFLNNKYGEGTAEKMIAMAAIPTKFSRQDYKVILFEMAHFIYKESESKHLFEWKESMAKYKQELILSIVEGKTTIDDEVILGKYRLP